MTTETQLTLAYEELPAVAGRKYLSENFKKSARASYFAPLSLILVREGFNKRIDYDGIEELSQSILIHGLIEPLTLDVLEDGRYFIEKGHRRHKALLLLLENGHIGINYPVEFFSNKAGVTELDRMVSQLTSNNLQHPLKPIEQASVVREVKYNYGKQYTHEELANLFGVSRQKIDMLILVAEASDDVRHAIKDMKFTKAVEYIRNQGSLQKQSDKAEEAAGQSSMYIQPDPQDLNAKEAKELEELEKDIAIKGTEEDNELSEEEIIERGKHLGLKMQAEEEKRLEKLAEIADHVVVSRENLEPLIGKKLAEGARQYWDEDFMNVGTGKVETMGRSKIILNKGVEINNETIETLLEESVIEIWVYKVNPVAESVITEPVAGKEKDKYDESREEIKEINNVIKLLDKIDNIGSKLPDSQASKDICDRVKWALQSAEAVREWVHKNKKQNKMR